MRYIIVIFSAFSLAILAGCSGSGIGDSDFGRTPGAETVLAEGAKTISAGAEEELLGMVQIGEKGLLVAVILWEGEPAQLTLLLNHIGTDLTAESSGGSPVAVTIDVSNDTVKAGNSWELKVSNPEGPDVKITYKVAFLKQ